MISKKNQFGLLVFSTILLWLFAIAIVIYWANQPQPKELNVERVNIVNADGTTVMAIANKERIAAPKMDNIEYPVEMIERQLLAGIVFFNEHGDEMGGLVFNSSEFPDGKKYGLGHLSFDRYKDNQVLNLEHKENIHGLVKSGLTIYDRTGNGSFRKHLDLMYEYQYTEVSDARRKEIVAEINRLKERGELGKERLFIGSVNEVPQFVLKDKLGNKRVQLYIDSTNIARLQFFNEREEQTHSYPER
ncbi:MAG: hypothetical protein AAGF96_11910 [Bacteroidota bacterium]